jgi:2-oxoisovalerate dehydrogenase E2 component (dihydrolipoyl transacylase)
MSVFRLPDVGEGLHEAEIVAWHVTAGDHVVADQPLVSVETDKAVVEIPSPQSGHIAVVYGLPGDVIAVGAVLVEFTEGVTADVGAIVGDIRSDQHPPAAPTGTRPGGVRVPVESVRAAPAVRALAATLGVDLASLTPTGPGHTITRADVEGGAGRASGSATGVPEPLRGIRRAMDARMSQAHSQVVPATVTDEADIGAWPGTTDLTSRLIRAVAVACSHEPALNASYLGRDRGLLVNERVDVGVAMDTEDGLFVPVLRDVANRDPDDLRRGLESMKADVASRNVLPEHLRGQTITLSNFGMFGGRHAALVVVPPQVAIVGAGRGREGVIAVHGAVAVTRLLPISLTFDHRVVMGGEATRFLNALITDLEAAS